MLDRDAFLIWVAAIATAGCAPAASPANARASKPPAAELPATATPAAEPPATPAPAMTATQAPVAPVVPVAPVAPVAPVVTVAAPDCSTWTPDLFACLRASCHPTACFTGGPGSLVGRKAHFAQRRP